MCAKLKKNYKNGFCKYTKRDQMKRSMCSGSFSCKKSFQEFQLFLLLFQQLHHHVLELCTVIIFTVIHFHFKSPCLLFLTLFQILNQYCAFFLKNVKSQLDMFHIASKNREKISIETLSTDLPRDRNHHEENKLNKYLKGEILTLNHNFK